MAGLPIDSKITDENLTVFSISGKHQFVYTFKHNKREYASYLVEIYEDIKIKSTRIVFENTRARIIPLRDYTDGSLLFLLQEKDSAGASIKSPELYIISEYRETKITMKRVNVKSEPFRDFYHTLNYAYQIESDKIVLENDFYKDINSGEVPITS